MTTHPSRDWSDKGGSFTTSARDELPPSDRRQAALFDQPGPANTGPQRTSWAHQGGPMVEPATYDIEQRAREVLARLDPSAADVLRVQGRHVSDRLASDALAKRDHVESSQTISAAMPRQPLWQPRQVSPLSEQRRQEIATAGRPRGGDYPGRGRELEDAADESWRSYLSERYGLALDDDLRHDAWLEQQAVEPPEDHYAGSPDYDDFDMPGQRGAADEYVQEQVQT